jgi:Tol biopolymer transport system component
MIDRRILGFLIICVFCPSCGGEAPLLENQFTSIPTLPPQGFLVTEIPPEMDIIFSSVRHGLGHIDCLTEELQLKENFIQDPSCNQVIYRPGGTLALQRQLFTLDIDTGDVSQITYSECLFVSGQVVNTTTLMTLTICDDTDQDGIVSDRDNPNLYFLDLPSGELDCLTCNLGLNAINNPDYSHLHEKILFSAQIDPVFHNYLFTIDSGKRLEQITNEQAYMDFDCSWSEDGTLIAFNRLPTPWFEHPAQIWLMSSDGKNLRQMTSGGSNPNGEGPHRGYPIGTDADADLSPDNSQIVFSRLRTGAENVPIGVWELVLIDVDSGTEKVLDSSYANMVPEWKTGGIVFTRQIGGTDPMQVKQALYLYHDGQFQALERFPFDVFPIGAFGGSWIE